MIKRIFRWQHWRARSKYWRRRALMAEAALEAECLRNREREDTLITVPMRSLGMFGMQPRSGPVLTSPQANPRAPALTAAADPWEALTWTDRQEFDMFWKTDAEAAGIPLQQARQKFLQELANRRMPLNDEPYGAN